MLLAHILGLPRSSVRQYPTVPKGSMEKPQGRTARHPSQCNDQRAPQSVSCLLYNEGK